MILFLVFSSDGRRGGEQYHSHLHDYFIQNFRDVYPDKPTKSPNELHSIYRHSQHSLKLVRTYAPRLLITDISTGIRNVMAINWAKRHGCKILIIVQGKRMTFRYGNLAPIRMAVRSCENYLLRSADIVVTNSNYMAQFVRTKARQCKIIVARPGIQISNAADDQVLGTVGNADKSFGILTVSEWTEPLKGMRYLLRALPLLNFANIRLDLVGGYSESNSYYRKLRKVIIDSGLEKNVIIHGFLEYQKLNSVYRQSDIFVLPSLSEGYGMVLAEAMAFGLPIVASNVAAIPELITDQKNGLLVEPKNPAALAKAISFLIDKPEIRKKMSQTNLEAARKLPTWNDFEAVLNNELLPAIEEKTGLKSLLANQ